jgi:hypothetical protein
MKEEDIVYHTIYEGHTKEKGGKWHTGSCYLLNSDTRTGESQIIGSQAKKPDPPKDQMCRKCWAFLFLEEFATKN